MTKTLSLVVPCYYEEQTIDLFYAAVEDIKSQLPGLELEYWFINDGSRDQTLAKMRALQARDPEHVHYASFSRNFGKEAAMLCGLRLATGDYVTVMDADLQDPPDMLPQMVEILETTDYDCVGTRRVDREGEPPIRSFFARMFYRIINKISDSEIVDGARDFRVMTRPFVNSVLELSEYNRFSKGIFSWVGYKTKYLPYENRERVAGDTSWNFWGLFKYSIDGLVNFSQFPLDIASLVGLFSSLFSGLGILFIVIRYLMYGDRTTGWASMVCIVLFIGGIQLLCLGILGKYIGKIFTEVKHRPIYIVKEKK
ncbi:glycosyltransferase family 2 protein [Ligilactobacillus saerimneri]|uniref:Glycosyltransferase n=1 Tax=Ligilactobacillus saerimneri TaxID=228229 RepID=A0A7H9ELI1_9LACO|nr:glycosyltransferase family 2 protein [Ligilactobacillus saerimneri]MBU5309615.1 glycosyltransferase family 2 protein [Ligilactobacillus saerimneri]MCZ0892160.1 glycosyltransferase family 2 protein [Ligilactobacillus saerimneri]MDY4003320.1 glycosyltransferase family 2 protein [Ligilactobacillus saerimneri]QLL78554.1 glycosyltransferase [Ligilactobacillus saerimneri]